MLFSANNHLIYTSRLLLTCHWMTLSRSALGNLTRSNIQHNAFGYLPPVPLNSLPELSRRKALRNYNISSSQHSVLASKILLLNALTHASCLDGSNIRTFPAPSQTPLHLSSRSSHRSTVHFRRLEFQLRESLSFRERPEGYLHQWGVNHWVSPLTPQIRNVLDWI